MTVLARSSQTNFHSKIRKVKQTVNVVNGQGKNGQRGLSKGGNNGVEHEYFCMVDSLNVCLLDCLCLLDDSLWLCFLLLWSFAVGDFAS